MTDPFRSLSSEDRAALAPAPHPPWVAPMLATLTHTPFSDPAWLFEPKLDGQRCLAFRDRSEVRLLSRTRRPLDGTYPEIVDTLTEQEARDFVIDGEVVAFDGDRTSFGRLQQRIGITNPNLARRSQVAVHFYAFDVLHLDGHDTTRLPLRARKELLEAALTFGGRLSYTSHSTGDGQELLAAACAAGWEGLIAKRADAAYVSGRSRAWLKLKCVADQELVIGGFTDPTGSRFGLGALLVGHYDGDDLVYAGKVGTGFSDRVLRDLHARLAALESDESPFAQGQPPVRGTHWVRPELVAHVGFGEWTSDGRLRHPRFLGLRDDKPARDVVRERA